MPPKVVDNNSSSSSKRGVPRTGRRGRRAEEFGASPTHSPPSTMATQTQTTGYALGIHQMPERARFPIILPSPAGLAAPRQTPLSTPSSPYAQEPVPSTFPHGPYTPLSTRAPPWSYAPPLDRIPPTHLPHIPPARSNLSPQRTSPEHPNPYKRSFDRYQEGPSGPHSPLSVLPPASIELREPYPRTVLPPLSTPSSVSNASTPTGTTASFPLHGHISTYSQPPSEVSSSSITSRCSLHIRQQPRAARAGPDGKDRRNIDPPPVLQLMMTDFDPDSPADISELKSNHYVVHCKLISAESPRRDVTTHTTISEDGSRETSRLLLGTNVASPFFCADDPDRPNMPQHPRSVEQEAPAPGPPSPSDHFIQSSATRRTSPSSLVPSSKEPPATLPGAFFIFADLSVRRAGHYRLEFTLMKIDPSATILPMIYVCASQVFKVVNAKDFDQVHASTRLVRGLLERGAPFPLKLKKGIREGQRRRMTEGEEGASVDGSNEGDFRSREGDDDAEAED